MNATVATIVLVTLTGLCLGPAARAQAPFVDGAFTLRSADNDPDLIVVRERFDPETRRQSLYLRVHDGALDYQVFSGRVLIEGARVVRFIFDGAELAATDAQWGLPALDYGGAAAGRGLEGPVVDAVPELRGLEDHLSRGPRGAVRFWLGSFDDIDDARLIIQYPAGLSPASFTVELFSLRFADPLGFPLSSTGGIQVGSLRDHTPDDGDYSEVFSTPPIKLRVEDLDLVERRLSLGQVDEGGGIAGPGAITVDNDFEGRDFDQDNGFDQNGLISPIAAAGGLEHLRWEASPLLGAGTGVRILPEQVRVEGLPERLGLGERATPSVRVIVPPDAPTDRYFGRLTVWEDNTADGERGRAEPSDSVQVGLVVGTPVDGGPDLGFPDGGGAAEVDGGDAAEADAGDARAGDASDSARADAGADAGHAAEDAAEDVGEDLPDVPPLDAAPSPPPDLGPGRPRGGAGQCDHGPGRGGEPLLMLLLLGGLWLRRSTR